MHFITHERNRAESFLNESKLIKEDRYHFVQKESKSYRLSTLAKAAIKDCLVTIDISDTCEKVDPSYKKLEELSVDLFTPNNKSYGEVFIKRTNKIHEIAELVIKKIKSLCIIDWARNTGQTECVISCEEFVEPYILNLNGKTYSKASITDLFVTSLPTKHGSCKLEDGTSIQRSTLENIKLFPNLSLWKGNPPNLPQSLRFSMEENIVSTHLEPIGKL